jgi:hypothetical protein
MIPNGAIPRLGEQRDKNPGLEERVIQIRSLQVMLRTAHG